MTLERLASLVDEGPTLDGGRAPGMHEWTDGLLVEHILPALAGGGGRDVR